MIRGLFRWAIRAGAVVGSVALVRRLLQRHDEPSPVSTAAPPYATRPPQARPAESPPAAAPTPAATPTQPTQKKAAPKKAARKKAAAAPSTEATAARAAAPSTETAAWIEPEGGACPHTHPVKAKQSSGIFHLPGMQNYDRTVPDRCYVDAAAAEADGLRPAKR